MEKRFIPHPVSLEERDDKPPKITGTAAVFYNSQDRGTEFSLASYGMPDAVERIAPGAFEGSLDQDTYAATNHDPSQVFARSGAGNLKLWTDARGLHYEAQPANTTAGRDIVENVRVGNIRGSSFAFSVDEEEWTEEGETKIRNVIKVGKLVDVSPVTSPAYEATKAGIRSDAAECRASYDAYLASKQPKVDTREQDDREHRARALAVGVHVDR